MTNYKLYKTHFTPEVDVPPAFRLGNAFSLNMLPPEGANIKIRALLPEEVEGLKNKESVRLVSCIGHESTALFVSALLGREIPANRVEVTLRNGELFVVCQMQGRLPEGKILTAEEIKAVKVKWFSVQAEYLPETIARLDAEKQAELHKMQAQELAQEKESDEPEEKRIENMKAALFGF